MRSMSISLSSLEKGQDTTGTAGQKGRAEEHGVEYLKTNILSNLLGSSSTVLSEQRQIYWISNKFFLSIQISLTGAARDLLVP